MYVFEPMKHIATLHLLYYLTLANGATLHQYKNCLHRTAKLCFFEQFIKDPPLNSECIIHWFRITKRSFKAVVRRSWSVKRDLL